MTINKMPLSILIIFLSFFGCRSSGKEYPEYEKVFSEFKTSVDTIVPVTPDKRFIKSYYTLNNWNKRFNTPINCEFELRGWIGVGGLTKTQRVIVICKNEGIFTARLLSFDRTVDNRGISNDSLINVAIKEIEPHSGWDKFTEEFFFKDFLSLFKLNKDYGEPGGIDGDSYYLEIISGNKYWLSDFPDPLVNNATSSDVISAKKIFSILQKEFL